MAMKPMTMEEYEITRDGNVINKRNGHVLKGQPNSKGYLKVNLCGKQYFIHRLVAEKYIPNPNNLEQVNHINGNKIDNRVENLEWMSNLENRKHAIDNFLHLQGEDCSWAKLNWNKVDYIRSHMDVSNRVLADMFNVNTSAIRDVKNFKTWKHRPNS